MDIQAVLFDLDGTLLSIDIDRFMQRYFNALSDFLAAQAHGNGLMEAVMSGTQAMLAPHPGRTNREVFHDVFSRLTGIPDNEQETLFKQFYDGPFDALRDDAGPAPGAREAYQAARRAGLKVVVATNPLFPLVAIEKRIAWAGFSPAEFDHVTCYENSTAVKPHTDYFLGICEAVDTAPAGCLMVGDDPELDMPAADCGMRTYLVGDGPAPGRKASDLSSGTAATDGSHGTLIGLANLLAGV
ncbi:MAG: HAD family hydrolase [Coriobacteriia bacterium]